MNITIQDNIVTINGKKIEFPYPIEKALKFNKSFVILINDDIIREDNIYAIDYNGNILWNISDLTSFKKKQGYVEIGKENDKILKVLSFMGVKCIIDMEKNVLIGTEFLK